MISNSALAEVSASIDADFAMSSGYLKPSKVNSVFRQVSRGKLRAVPVDRSGQKIAVIESDARGEEVYDHVTGAWTYKTIGGAQGVHHSYAVMLEDQRVGGVFFTGNYLYRYNSDGIVKLVENVLRHVDDQDTRAQFYQGVKLPQGYEVSRIGKTFPKSKTSTPSPQKPWKPKQSDQNW